MTEDNRLKGICSWLFKCLITIGILYWLFLKVPISQVISALANTRVIYLIPAFLLQIGMRYISAAQLKVLTQHQKMNFNITGLLKINLISQFYGLLLPGELSASLVKWYKLSKQNKMRAQAVACIIFARIINILCLAALGSAFFLVERPYNSIPIAVSLVLGLAVSVMLYLSIAEPRVSSGVKNLVNKCSFYKIPNLIREKLTKVWNSIRSFQKLSPPSLNYTLFLSFLFHLAGILSIYLTMKAVNIDVSIVSVVWIRAAVIFIQMLPISISGLGVREGTFVFLLTKYSISAVDAMAMSFLLFGISVAIGLIGGLLEAKDFFKGTFSKSELKK